MKAITILQPWASLIACGAKRIETRGWSTKYRGPIAIHAGMKQMPKDYYGLFDLFPSVMGFWYGRVIAIADLVDCVKMIDFKCNRGIPYECFLENGQIVRDKEYLFGDYSLGRYAWLLENVRPITPVPARGQQGLWNWEGRM